VCEREDRRKEQRDAKREREKGEGGGWISISTSAIHASFFNFNWGIYWVLGFARLDHFEQSVPHGLPLTVENRADSVGELPPSLRIEHLLN
jgi:hypothetical protein